MLKEIIILVLVGYIISKILRFILPIFRISSVASDHMRKMQEQMKDMEAKANQPVQKKNVRKEGDYIDYEEVK
jgi:hypothetical protein